MLIFQVYHFFVNVWLYISYFFTEAEKENNDSTSCNENDIKGVITTSLFDDSSNDIMVELSQQVENGDVTQNNNNESKEHSNNELVLSKVDGGLPRKCSDYIDHRKLKCGGCSFCDKDIKLKGGCENEMVKRFANSSSRSTARYVKTIVENNFSQFSGMINAFIIIYVVNELLLTLGHFFSILIRIGCMFGVPVP